MPCMHVGKDRDAAMCHSRTSRHLPTPKAADMEQIIKQPKEEGVHVETIQS